MASIVTALPETGHLEIDIKVRAEMKFSARAARQKVNHFVLSEISYMMHAGEPALVVDRQIRWRVPVILSLTSKGDVGEVGSIDVDVETGHLLVNPRLVMEIEARAQDLATRAPHPAGE